MCGPAGCTVCLQHAVQQLTVLWCVYLSQLIVYEFYVTAFRCGLATLAGRSHSLQSLSLNHRHSQRVLTAKGIYLRPDGKEGGRAAASGDFCSNRCSLVWSREWAVCVFIKDAANIVAVDTISNKCMETTFSFIFTLNGVQIQKCEFTDIFLLFFFTCN